MFRKVIPLVVQPQDSAAENRTRVRASTNELARDGHILEPSGLLTANFLRSGVALFDHDPKCPVATPVVAELADGGAALDIEVEWPPAGISADADKVRGLVKAGVIRGVSIGFDVIDAKPLDAKNPRGGQHILSADLLELSFVSVPADTGAVVTQRAADAAKTQEQSVAEKDESLKARHTRTLAVATGTTILKRGLYEVASLAYLLEQFGYAHACSEWEAEVEGDESPVPAMLGEALTKIGAAFIAMTKEEVTELLAAKDLELDESEIPEPERAYVAAGTTRRARAWRTGIAMQRAGKSVSASNQKKLGQALDHQNRAGKHLKSAMEHHTAVSGHMDAITEQQSKMAEAHGELGEALHAIKNEPEKATEHVARAMKAHKAMTAPLADSNTEVADAKDKHMDVGDSHEALGRCMKAATRCVRGVIDGASTAAEDKDGDSEDVQTSDGAGDTDGSKNDRSLSAQRRQKDLEALRAVYT